MIQKEDRKFAKCAGNESAGGEGKVPEHRVERRREKGTQHTRAVFRSGGKPRARLKMPKKFLRMCERFLGNDRRKSGAGQR